jgi:hypothetical protein
MRVYVSEVMSVVRCPYGTGTNVMRMTHCVQFLTVCRQEMSEAVWQAFQAKTRQYHKHLIKTKRQVKLLADEIEGLWLTSTGGDDGDDDDDDDEADDAVAWKEGDESAAEGMREESMSTAAEGDGRSEGDLLGQMHRDHALAAALAAHAEADAITAAANVDVDVELND